MLGLLALIWAPVLQRPTRWQRLGRLSEQTVAQKEKNSAGASKLFGVG
jgi:hypothetical protein